MKNFNFLLTFSLLFITSLLSAQTGKHLWQLPDRPPVLQFNQNGQMSVFTYDRLSIYNVESGNLEKSYDFLSNRSPFIWPTTELIYFSENFNTFRIYGQNKDLAVTRGVYVRFNAEKEVWEETEKYKYPNESFQGIDIQGREVVFFSPKIETWLLSPKGKKLKKLASSPYVRIIQGGRFAIYGENNQTKLFDLSIDSSKLLEIKGRFEFIGKSYPEWYIFEEGEKITLFNPFTNEVEVKDPTDPYLYAPSKYIPCLANFRDAINFGEYSYRLIIHEDGMTGPDPNGAVPYLIEQYKVADCSFVKFIPISASENENVAQAASVGFIYDGVKLMDAKYKAESQARKDWDAAHLQKMEDKKEAEELSKELLLNFVGAGDSFSFSLSTLQGRDISNLPYTKKYLGHIQGEINAIAQLSTCGTSKILLIAVRNGTATSFKLLKLHYEGAYRYTKDLATVDTHGDKLTQNLTISLVNTGSSIRAELTKTNLATGKQETNTVFAPCSGDWK